MHGLQRLVEEARQQVDDVGESQHLQQETRCAAHHAVPPQHHYGHEVGRDAEHAEEGHHVDLHGDAEGDQVRVHRPLHRHVHGASWAGHRHA